MCQNRKMLGSPMSNLQLILAKLRDMFLDIDASVHLIYRVALTKTIVHTEFHVRLPWPNYLHQNRNNKL